MLYTEPWVRTALDCTLHHLPSSLNNPKTLSAFAHLPDSLRNLHNAPGGLPKRQTSSWIDLYKDHVCTCGHWSLCPEGQTKVEDQTFQREYNCYLLFPILSPRPLNLRHTQLSIHNWNLFLIVFNLHSKQELRVPCRFTVALNWSLGHILYSPEAIAHILKKYFCRQLKDQEESQAKLKSVESFLLITSAVSCLGLERGVLHIFNRAARSPKLPKNR